MISNIKQYFYRSYNPIYYLYRFYKNIAANILHFWSKKKLIYCIGDSHNRVFDYISKTAPLNHARLRCVTVTGATVFGLANPNSSSNSLSIFKRELRYTPKRATICIMLGEIDCGFLIFLRAKNNSTSINEEILESIRRYESFIKKILNMGFRDIIIFSVPPQTITDSDTGEIANIRKKANTTLKKRIDATKQYNNLLAKLCAKLSIRFIDMDPVLVDKKTNMPYEVFLPDSPNDHHLCVETVAPIYKKKLYEAAIRQDSNKTHD